MLNCFKNVFVFSVLILTGDKGMSEQGIPNFRYLPGPELTFYEL